MGDFIFGSIEERFSVTAVGTTAGVTATKAAPSNANAFYCATGIQASGDAAAIVTIESPSATVLWRKRFTGAFNMSETFPPGSLNGAAGQAILFKISASTANCEVNGQGYRL